MKTVLTSLSILLSIPALARVNCMQTPVTLGENDFKVQLSSYIVAASKKHVLIIPPTGGANFIDRNWAKNFCAKGFNAHIVEHWTLDAEAAIDLGLHQRFYSRTQKAIGIVLEHLKDASFIGMMGTSIGGIHTAMAMGIHDRIDAAFVITAGADMPAMIANSDQVAMVNVWNKRKDAFNIPDKKTYIELLREKIEYEPLKLPRKFEGKDLGMIVATSDTTVPYDNQLKLKNHWKPKTLIEYSNNHFWGIVFSWLWDSGKVIEFFQQSADKKS